MIETHVKWCCDMERVPYQPRREKLMNVTNYTVKDCKHVQISINENNNEQMTMFDYMYERKVI